MNIRAQLIAPALIAFVVPTAHAKPGAKPQSKASAPLRSWAKTQLARQDYGLYAMGHKVGWMTMQFRVVPDAAAPGGVAAVSSTQMELRVRSASGAPDISMTQEQRFSLAPGGALLSARLSSVQNGSGTTYSLAPATPGAAKFQLTTVSAGHIITRPAAAPRENLETTRRMMAWLGGARSKGEKFSYWSTSLDSTDFNSPEVLAFGARRNLAWGGVPSVAYQVTMISSGTAFDGLLRPNGMLVSGKLSGIEVRAEEPKVARDLSQAGVDLLSASLIKIDRKLGAPWNLSRLKLEATGVSELSLPQSKRQSIAKSGSAFVITLAPEAPGNAPAILSAAQRSKYLAATTSMQSDDAGLQKLARSIVGGEQGTLKKSEALMRWVYRTLGKSMDANSSTALQVLETKKGDCTEHALLFTAMARSVGIPARQVTGLAYVESPEPMFGWHAWSEVNDGQGWISIDPTWNEARVDASHIKFSDNEDDLSWANAIGKLKLRVLEAK